MSTSERDIKAPALSRLDRPSQAVPSVDDPWEAPRERAQRVSRLSGDRAGHRLYHGLFEDMLN